jgi:hypothetical protein
VKKFIFSFLLIINLIIPLPQNANAADKCLSSFVDSDWMNGTPIGVKSQLGFDLIEKVEDNGYPSGQLIGFRNVDPFYLLGEYKIETTYTYVGKNCETRIIKVTDSRTGPNVKLQTDSLSTFIEKGTFYNGGSTGLVREYNKNSFLDVEFRKKSIAAISEYMLNNSIKLSKTKSITPGDPGNGWHISKILSKVVSDANDPEYVKTLLNTNNEHGYILPIGTWFVSFPDKCGYAQFTHPKIQKVFAIGIPSSGNPSRTTSANFNLNSDNKCTGELRVGGVSEKISNVVFEYKPISNSKSTINCTKGKTTKSVSGINPKCPTGYKKK